jgi:hypothetical protein
MFRARIVSGELQQNSAQMKFLTEDVVTLWGEKCHRLLVSCLR